MSDASVLSVDYGAGATPAGLQSTANLKIRRVLVLGLNLVTYLALMASMAVALGPNGWSLLDAVILAAFAIGAPWTVLGFWNAVIGLCLLRGTPDPLGKVAPFAAAGDSKASIGLRIAILMTLRNEDPARAFLRLRSVKASLDATGYGDAFTYFILSDTDRIDVAAAEMEAAEAWARDIGESDRIVYRRRDDNSGFKAGNIRDFCERFGAGYDLMLPLDADSLMSGPAIVRLTRMMQSHPKIGILQSLVVGMPSRSVFARIFQFGMRHGMRPYTMGSAWWTGDCGPFWGHNALVRIAPFREHCHLPTLPGKPPLGGPILSHDQVEATFMRRAGYEVRVLPEEIGSFEENPPTVLDFSRRDRRWCQGNMQYGSLIGAPGLLPMSRFQLAWAMLMFLGVPAWTLMIALLPFKALTAGDLDPAAATFAQWLYVGFLAMYLTPKLAGFCDVLLSKDDRARYGGSVRFLAGAATELVFSFLLGAITTFSTSIFMLGLLFGKSVSWGGQQRDAHALTWNEAVAALWPVFSFGLAICGALAWISPVLLVWSLPLTAGYLLAIPFAVLTASPSFGRYLARIRLCGIPEEFDPPAELMALHGARPIHREKTMESACS